MASYRRRLESDLDAWIRDGLVPAASREAILAGVGRERRLDAATALAAIGAFLAGAAVIAFVAANWSEIPRIVRFGLILAAFLASALGAAWAAGRGREVTKNVLLSVAALVFAAAIGLTGQIFDLAGDPAAALRGAGLGAAVLALAGRSPWAGAAAVLLTLAGDAAAPGVFDGVAERLPYGRIERLPWTLALAPLAAALAIRWRSAPLAHAAGLAAVVIVALRLTSGEPRTTFLVTSLVFAGLAAAARHGRERYGGPTTVLYGWCVLGALAYFGLSGFGDGGMPLLHPVAWLALSAGAVALGRHDAHAIVSAVGVVSLIAAGLALLFDLGVGLLASAGVFAGLAVIALAIAVLLRRSSPA
ncbi:DUF2157 domain-containing protein [Phenylobacterium sp.]|uniref:DUF2157 domain-containing protein n=1 Tax=Phenylobacterium sp. TaxID=1871053 RepID=UPI0035AEFBD6